MTRLAESCCFRYWSRLWTPPPTQVGVFLFCIMTMIGECLNEIWKSGAHALGNIIICFPPKFPHHHPRWSYPRSAYSSLVLSEFIVLCCLASIPLCIFIMESSGDISFSFISLSPIEFSVGSEEHSHPGVICGDGDRGSTRSVKYCSRLIGWRFVTLLWRTEP